jgi:hypothetical protein
MGGYNSGGRNRKNVTVEGCVKVDVGQIRRAGLFDVTQPAGASWDYNCRQRHTCTVIAIGGHMPGQLQLVIITPDKAEHRQQVKISTTPCNYGRARHWLHCPRCSRRAFRLYYYPHTVNSAGQYVHYFACRHCLELTYQQRRERGFDLYQSRAMNAHDKLKAWARRHGLADYKPGAWDELPDKPAGMRWATYAPIAERWHDAAMLANDAFVERTVALIGRMGLKQ